MFKTKCDGVFYPNKDRDYMLYCKVCFFIFYFLNDDKLNNRHSFDGFFPSEGDVTLLKMRVPEEDGMAANSDKTIAYGNIKNRAVFAARNYWSGLLFGIGVMAFGIGTIFYQLLQWSHFYNLASEEAGIFSDGLLNLFAWGCSVTGLFLLAGLRKRKALWPKRWVGSALMGSGIYLLFDGLIVHKLLKFHQIRYDTDLLPYDTVWIASGGIFLLTGLLMVIQTKKENHRK